MREIISVFKNKNPDPEKKFIFICWLLFFVFLLLNLFISYDKKTWEGFPDCYDYIAQSKLDFFSKQFFFPTIEQIKFPRAFSVPLIYKLVNSDPEKIVILQKIIYSASIAFFLYSTSVLFKKLRLKYA